MSTPTRITHLVGHRAWQGEPGRTSEVCNPATGEVTGTLDLASAETVGEVVAKYMSGDKEAALAAVPDDMVRETMIVGTQSDVRDQIKQWEAAGVTMLMVTARDIETIEQLATLV